MFQNQKIKQKAGKNSFFLNFCPHLPTNLSRFQQRWTPSYKTEIVNQSCFGCRELDIWICLTNRCDFLGCGRTKKKHMLGHHESSHHPTAMNLREMDVWCFSCDRFLGESDTLEEEKQIIKRLRQLLLTRENLSSHRSTLWKDL